VIEIAGAGRRGHTQQSTTVKRSIIACPLSGIQSVARVRT